MLKVKHFPKKDGKIDDQEFNEFSATHAPKQNDKQSGLIINPDGILFFYEDGETYDGSEQVAWLREQIRTKKHEILVSEPALRQKRIELEKFQQLLADAKGASTNTKDKIEYDKKQDIKRLEKIVEETEAFILATEKGQELSRETIASYTSVLADIENGTWKL